MQEGSSGLAAVCGLFCGACPIFIGTAEEPARLKLLAQRFGVSEEEARCHGCRSEKRFAHCANCRMTACAAERGIRFCSECNEYPCAHLREFQSQMPHRAELWNDLGRIAEVGEKEWLQEVAARYTCPQCETLNGFYDLACRKCGEKPGSKFVERHGEAIAKFLKG